MVDIGGKGLFTKEIDAALLDGRVALAVHSLKDLPTVLPDGIALVCVPEREDPRDALISSVGASIAALPPGRGWWARPRCAAPRNFCIAGPI